MNSYIKSAASFLLDIVFTVKCPYCEKVIDRQDYACNECKSKFPQKGFETYAIGGYKTVSPFKYDGIFASGVKNFKFNQNPAYSRQLAVPLINEIMLKYDISTIDIITAVPMLMYGKEASNRKQEIDRQHYTIPNQRPKDKHCGKI